MNFSTGTMGWQQWHSRIVQEGAAACYTALGALNGSLPPKPKQKQNGVSLNSVTQKKDIV